MQHKSLKRSRKNKIIAGICGGIGEYLRVDPTIIRIIFILLLFGWGSSFLLYVILMFVIPLDDGRIHTHGKDGDAEVIYHPDSPYDRD